MHQNVKKVPRKFYLCKSLLLHELLVVVVPLSEAPGFAVLCLVFPERSRSAFLSE